MLLRVRNLLAILCVLVMISGCATLKEDEIDTSEVEGLYLLGKEAMDSGDYLSAIQHYESLEVSYPFGVYAQQALLDIAYVYYKNADLDMAVAAADRFIKTYPRHDKVDYAYYLRGVARFVETGTDLDRLFGRTPNSLDPRSARESFRYFVNLVEKFPESIYVPDAMERMAFLRNHLASHEILVAQFYYKRKAYVAALNRAINVLQTYAETPSVTDALEVMVQSYDALGMNNLASDTRRVIALNQ